MSRGEISYRMTTRIVTERRALRTTNLRRQAKFSDSGLSRAG